jgi:hypothetical protein
MDEREAGGGGTSPTDKKGFEESDGLMDAGAIAKNDAERDFPALTGLVP